MKHFLNIFSCKNEQLQKRQVHYDYHVRNRYSALFIMTMVVKLQSTFKFLRFSLFMYLANCIPNFYTFSAATFCIDVVIILVHVGSDNYFVTLT